MGDRVLITGGTGMVGDRLKEILVSKGYQVSFLTRASKGRPNYYEWDVVNGTIDDNAVLNADHVIHLAGSNVAEKRWTPAVKKEIIESRVKSADIILQSLIRTGHQLKSFISASGSGIYGVNSGEAIMSEDSPSGTDFLADVCVKWENSANNFSDHAENIVKLRIGIVLSKTGGALQKMLVPLKFGIASAFGSGKQYMSWIHIDDLCFGIEFMICNKMNGTYNMVAEEPVTNLEFTKALAKLKKIPFIAPSVPSFVLKTLLGEMSGIVLGGNRVSSKKLTSKGYHFKYTSLYLALNDLL